MATHTTQKLALLPRLLRLRDVSMYMGMDRNRFNKEVRPQLTEIPIGEQGIAFDRYELDAWIDAYKLDKGRRTTPKGDNRWDARKHPVSSNVMVSGKSTNVSGDGVFAKALGQINSKKRNATSQG